jgi:rhamnulokinase
MSRSATKSSAHIAVDLGAQSCRVSLLRLSNEGTSVEVVHRFENAPREIGGGLRWNLSKIVSGVEHGLRLCSEMQPEGIQSVGVDGWAVDYVRVDESGIPLADPYCYRDERTVAAEKSAHELCSPERMRDITGIQLLRINTAYQLHADSQAQLSPGAGWSNLPEYLLMRWGAERISEYTNASHTQLLDLRSRQWSAEIFGALRLDLTRAPKLVPPGTDLGKMAGELSELPAFRATRLIAPACHDTASAIAGIPDDGEEWAYISSGTWSLVGTVLSSPCNGAAAARENFTNLGSVGNRYCFHKNVNGMWLLAQCLNAWAQEGSRWEIERLLAAAEQLPKPAYLIEVDDPDLLLAGRMPDRINEQLSRCGYPILDPSSSNAPEFASLIFHSMASRYAEVLQQVRILTGKKFSKLYVVGGAARNSYMNRLTREATNLEVRVGPAESATIGNFAIQLACLSGAVHQNNDAMLSEIRRLARNISVTDASPAA